ncbi:Pepsin-retropepsin like protein [Abeliophyllum distichum]|uniref:Pepsin-retropepsin like protein n=1 Tax=Abeliophyllum distichum TaxID=126358 RepID=A0ABD1REA0_9LAMI
MVEQFCHFKPPSFNGKDDPFAAEEWLRRLEGIFEHLNCNDMLKVSYAKFMLIHDASRLWESDSRTKTTEQQRSLTWNQFQEALLENGNGQNKKANNGSRSSKLNEVIPPCPKYNRNYRGECLYGKNVCYRCGKSGHIVRNFKKPPPKRDNEKGKGREARVFALNQQKAAEANYQEHSD